jgi:hypothetical protein
MKQRYLEIVQERLRQAAAREATIEGTPAEVAGAVQSGQWTELASADGSHIHDAYDDDPVACRGCAAVIRAGTTLCQDCGSKKSPLVRLAVELSSLAQERSSRGRALVALDRRRYPRLRLRDGRRVGPGLLAWGPVLREMDSDELEHLLAALEGDLL